MLPAISNFLRSVPAPLHSLVLRDFSDDELSNRDLAKRYEISIVLAGAMRQNFSEIYQRWRGAEKQSLRLVRGGLDSGIGEGIKLSVPADEFALLFHEEIQPR